jgi:hypothetical protein
MTKGRARLNPAHCVGACPAGSDMAASLEKSFCLFLQKEVLFWKKEPKNFHSSTQKPPACDRGFVASQ